MRWSDILIVERGAYLLLRCVSYEWGAEK